MSENKIVLLNAAHTRNGRAWLARCFERISDFDRFVVISVKEFEDEDGRKQTSCSTDYFNMNEVMLTWIACKIADCAAEMRGGVDEIIEEE